MSTIKDWENITGIKHMGYWWFVFLINICIFSTMRKISKKFMEAVSQLNLQSQHSFLFIYSSEQWLHSSYQSFCLLECCVRTFGIQLFFSYLLRGVIYYFYVNMLYNMKHHGEWERVGGAMNVCGKARKNSHGVTRLRGYCHASSSVRLLNTWTKCVQIHFACCWVISVYDGKFDEASMHHQRQQDIPSVWVHWILAQTSR